MKHLLAAAAVLATLANTSFAGEMTIFADSNFRGNRVTLERDARNLSEFGFNDRISSVVIRSGIWQLCEDANFRGRCAELGPGEYRQLPFNDSVSSIREISRGGPGRGPGWDRDDRDGRDGRHGGWDRDDRRGGPDVILFQDRDFRGPDLALERDARNLIDYGFNDRASSIVIREGRWEFCEDVDFRGRCEVFGPGRYPMVDMNDRISSVRRVR
ncbi:beta/gamma crystallin-related protein [Massilia sp. TN1-12]|uniref:beta/gamma crystallin-related protein n=1 Tax=Massilia paldalensis TaxID=3377675 RepID=UPI0038517B96